MSATDATVTSSLVSDVFSGRSVGAGAHGLWTAEMLSAQASNLLTIFLDNADAEVW
jgi:hypothetical protein